MAMQKYSLDLSLHFQNEKEAEIVYRTVIPDIVKKHKRSCAEIECKHLSIRFKVVALDAVALRASFNSFMKHVALSKKIMENFHNIH